MMHSLKTKIIVLVLLCIIVSSTIIGGSSIVNAKNVVAKDSVKIMNLLCENRANEIDSLFLRIQQSVETLAVYASQQIGDFEKFKTSDVYVNQYSDNMFNVAVNAARTTEGAAMVYVRFNPEFTSPTSGIFCAINPQSKEYQKLTPTDLSKYDKSNKERVGWFWKPVEKRTGTWIEPYENLNAGINMISYVVPYYIDGELVGVVGMDIDVVMLEDIVSNTHLYDSGYAFLTSADGKIVYHNELKKDTNLFLYNYGEFSSLVELFTSQDSSDDSLIQYTYHGEKREAAFRSLVNNMRFIVTVPESETNEQANLLILRIVITLISIIIIAVIATIIFTKKLVRPLLELTDISKKIANGDLSVTIVHHSKDEVGILAESFRQTVSHLHKYISYINELAYRDSLTGVKSKTAYSEKVKQLDIKTSLGYHKYAVVFFDINGLKVMNDTHGHDFGDVLIINSCRIICNTFKQSPVYRIGGDEFVAILENADCDNALSLIQQFQNNIDDYNSKTDSVIKVSVASGLAFYSNSTDINFHDVFKRADNEMYENKSKYKNNNQK